MEVQCHNEREAKEKKFLRDVARYGFAVQKILQDDRINHRKILNLLTSSPNHAHLHSLLTYILEHSLQEIPHTIVNALGKVIVNEDQCDNAIGLFCKAAKNKRGLFLIANNKRYYQKSVGGETLISSDGKFLLPSRLQRILTTKINHLYDDIMGNTQIGDLDRINDYAKGFFELKIIDGVIVVFVIENDIFQQINNSHDISMDPRSIKKDGTIPTLLSHIIFNYMPPAIQELLDNMSLPKLSSQQESIVGDITSTNPKPKEVQEILLKLINIDADVI